MCMYMWVRRRRNPRHPESRRRPGGPAPDSERSPTAAGAIRVGRRSHWLPWWLSLAARRFNESQRTWLGGRVVWVLAARARAQAQVIPATQVLMTQLHWQESHTRTSSGPAGAGRSASSGWLRLLRPGKSLHNCDASAWLCRGSGNPAAICIQRCKSQQH